MQTSSAPEGPYLVVTECPAGSTDAQVRAALEAAHRVFDVAGVDPVAAEYADPDDPASEQRLAELWAAAERAATEACWAPRPGRPRRTLIAIYRE